MTRLRWSPLPGSVAGRYAGGRVRQANRSSASTSNSAARPGGRLRRRRHRGRCRGHRHRRLFQRRPDCTAATTACWPQALRRLVAAPYRQGQRQGTVPDDPDALFGPVNNSRQLAQCRWVYRAAAEATPRSRPARKPDHRPWRRLRLEPTVLSGLRQDDEAIQNDIRPGQYRPALHRRGTKPSPGANGVDYGLASVWMETSLVARCG